MGQTKQTLQKRWKGHCADALANKRRGCVAINRAIRRYGKDGFSVEVLEANVDDADLNWMEDFYIVYQNALSPAGYNMKIMSLGPSGFSDKTRAYMSKIKKAQWADPEVRKNLSNCHSDEAVRKIVNMYAERRNEKALTMSPEDVEKMQKRYEKDQKNRHKQREKRQALRDSDKAAAWLAENAKMTPDDRKRETMFLNRMKRLSLLPPIEFHQQMLKLKTSALATAKHNGKPVETIERWFPNVLTAKEIAALKKNEGVWPGSVPGPPASSCAQASEDRSWMIPSDSE